MKTKLFAALILCFTICGNMSASQLCLTVSDQGDQPLPSASVVLYQFETGKSSTLQPNVNGKACFLNIREGLYSIEAGMTGFLNVRYYPVHVSAASPVELNVRLPFGETGEGGVGTDVVLSGTLRQGTVPLESANLCLREKASGRLVRCVQTTEIGEYAIIVEPGIYTAEIRPQRSAMRHPLFKGAASSDEHVYRMDVDLSAPGNYMNVVTVPAPSPSK